MEIVRKSKKLEYALSVLKLFVQYFTIIPFQRSDRINEMSFHGDFPLCLHYAAFIASI